ncbi:MAG: excinuclease ABC subunit UvrA [Verrucomicrobiaceae bacterium]
MAKKAKSKNVIQIRGARQHNLKNVDLDIPIGELTVITGPSGSGKSSLAFHTLYAEGQRRYVETFSPYVRQFFDRMDKPDVDRIDGIPPAIAIEQKNTIRTTRSTVGTLTEVNDYLKLLYPRLATGYHPQTGEPVQPDTPATILSWCEKNHAEETILVLFPIPVPPDTKTDDFFTFLNSQGYLRILLNGEVTRTDESSDQTLPAEVQVIQDRIKVSPRNKSRLTEAFENALQLGKGNCQISNLKSQISNFTSSWSPLRQPTSSLFSFNSPLGACQNCRGFGRVIGIDLEKAVPNHLLSLRQGAVKPFQGERGDDCQRDLLRNCKEVGIDPKTPWNKLTPEQRRWVKYGERSQSSPLSSLEQSESLWQEGRWYGIQGFFDWLETKAYKMHVRVFLSRYRAYTTCPECQGNRLQPEALSFKILGKTLPELWHIPIDQLVFFFDSVAQTHAPLDKSTQLVLTEIQSRLHYLVEVGLGYLTLDRPARTLSGGEIARVNLTTCLGSALTHTLFVLDEPTVGLHHRDIGRLTEVMHALRDKGNTLVVVEHDEAVMREADNLIDVGPAAGEGGGQIVFQGNVQRSKLDVQRSKFKDSQTLPFLTGERSIATPKKLRKPKSFLGIRSASANNIEDLSLDLPLGTFTCLTGVSGSGKSSLAHPIIYNNLARHFGLPLDEEPAAAEIDGIDELNGVQLIDQSPLSRTPRSTPAVLLGAFEHFRQLFALTSAARSRELTPGYFSFNSGPGRCQRCAGNGFEKVEMQFLSDLFLTCPECNGSRFTRAAQEILLHGKSITDILQLTATEGLAFLEELPTGTTKEETLARKARLALQPLVDTGLGYLRLGQPLNTLSGGEAQRLKLCQLLSSSQGSINTLLILDEPTTGLHFVDIERLLTVFHRLVDIGFSLLVIEHQPDVIKNADHVIELGPEAGVHGGKIVFEGTPKQLAKKKTHTAAALSNKTSKAKRAPRPAKEIAKDQISISGLRHHNLKNIDVTIPHHEFVVISGLSGSGKSTLAFDVIFAEGQRRFLDSMSPYARQFASQLEKPDLDHITGLPPTVAIEQRISRGGGKSTVGTVTEIYHFLRLLYAKVGIQHCPQSGEAVISQTPEAIARQIGALLKKHKSLRLLAPVLKARKGFHKEYAAAAEKAGLEEMFIDGKLIRTEDFQPLARHKAHDIDFVITGIKSRQPKQQIAEHIARTLQIGKGTIRILSDPKSPDLTTFSTSRVSEVTGESFEELDPHHFSFNSPRGWCTTCRGYGHVAKGATKQVLQDKGFNSQAEAEIYEEKSLKEPDEIKECPDCQGARLRESSRHVFIQKTSLPALTALSVKDAKAIIDSLKFTGRDREIARDIIPEISQRLQFLDHVGLGYLQLDRSATTLSGGESQRIRLAAQLGSNLQGVLYILDEPTIGLHPRDNDALLGTLQALRKKGNSLILVEHDEDTIRAATHLIDLGPGAGVEGGEIVASLSQKQVAAKTTLKKHPLSPTLNALASPLVHPSRGSRRKILKAKKHWLQLKGCTLNNLKDLDAQIPLGRLTVLTGVSGSGKSSLMRGCLAEAAKTSSSTKSANRILPTANSFKTSQGFEHFKYLYEVDQSPIGKTSRSCPATYVKLFDHIRALYAQLPEARMRGYTASRFSFNNKDGQCPECKGNGRIKLEMDFLPTTWVDCESCYGQRYNPSTLEIRYNGLTIGDVLNLNIKSAAEFFAAHPKLQRPLQLLSETGLGYLTLGQPSPTVSGGEAQRLKLVTQLTKGRPRVTDVGPTNTNLYLIEEPTIGLHQQDVARLTDVLHRLVDEGHTVVVIEHHMDLAAEADYIIDLGPEAGPHGGQIIAQGTPEQVAKSKTSKTAPYIAAALKTPSPKGAK